jgi:hypothetical protein
LVKRKLVFCRGEYLTRAKRYCPSTHIH